MTILSTADKEKVKRAIPKATNKIIDATVARLYVSLPDSKSWTYTGLVGAVAFVDDLVGHTFFLKMVDVVGSLGVVWDQELYLDFAYNQDRLFFHTFEMEDCYAGLLFQDKGDAQHFFKRVTHRKKYASKKTLQNNKAIELKRKPQQEEVVMGKRGDVGGVAGSQRVRRQLNVIYYDNEPPEEWRSFYKELEAVGITEDVIAQNREFIKDYIAQKGGPLVGKEPPIPRKYAVTTNSRSRSGSVRSSPAHGGRSRSTTVGSAGSSRRKKAPPPPPPPAGGPSPGMSTDSLVSGNGSPDGANASTSSLPTPTVSAPAHHFVPPLPANMVSAPPAQTNRPLPALPPRAAGSPFPAPPQRPVSSFPLPPQRNGGPGLPPRMGGGPPPPPPSRGPAPPPPPPRTNSKPSMVSGNLAGRVAPPPPPPRRTGPPPPPSRHTPASYNRPAAVVPQQPQQSFSPFPPPQPQASLPAFSQSPPPTSFPVQTSQFAAPPAPPPVQSPVYSQPPPASFSAPPPAPPAPPAAVIPVAPPPPAMTPAPPAPPPPPMMTGASAPPGPPPPPAMPTASSAPSAPLAGGDARDALLASIRGAGIGSLKKTDKAHLDRPSVILQESRGEPVSKPSSGGPPGQPATLADALNAALNKRKKKVAQSDDEDDW